jgi:hypothetical protein
MDSILFVIVYVEARVFVQHPQRCRSLLTFFPYRGRRWYGLHHNNDQV